MANLLFRPVQARDREIKLICGRATIGSSGSIASQAGMGAVISRTGTGSYTLTFEQKYFDIRGINIAVVSSTPLQAFIVTESVASAKTITFQTKSAFATAADPSSGDKIVWHIACKNGQAL